MVGFIQLEIFGLIQTTVRPTNWTVEIGTPVWFWAMVKINELLKY